MDDSDGFLDGDVVPADGCGPGLSPDEVAAWAALAPLGSGLLTPWGVLDPAALSDTGRIDALRACQRLTAWVDAQEQRLLAAMSPARDRVEKGFVRDEIGCALRLPPATVSDRMSLAAALVSRLPATLALLETGAITLRHARVLAEALIGSSDTVARGVQARVLDRAPRQSVAAFRACVQRAVLALDPRDAEHKHQQALADRRVCARAVGNGMGELWALLPLDGLATLMTHLNITAGTPPPADQRSTDQRTVDQRRADALIALAAAAGTDGSQASGVGTWQGRRPAVQVTVAATTLLGVDDQPGELDGYGPIPASMARAIAADPTGTWRRLLTDPADGRLLDYGRQVYRPPQHLTDFVVARDRRCRFPGCTRQARRCHLDHQLPYDAGGTTSPGNCQSLCSRHHHLKHETAWQVTGDPRDELAWTSPTGHTYRSPPGTYE